MEGLEDESVGSDNARVIESGDSDDDEAEAKLCKVEPEIESGAQGKRFAVDSFNMFGSRSALDEL